MNPKKVTMTYIRSTKNKDVYDEQSDEAPIIGTLYVVKWFSKGAKKLTVTVEGG